MRMDMEHGIPLDNRSGLGSGATLKARWNDNVLDETASSSPRVSELSRSRQETENQEVPAHATTAGSNSAQAAELPARKAPETESQTEGRDVVHGQSREESAAQILDTTTTTVQPSTAEPKSVSQEKLAVQPKNFKRTPESPKTPFPSQKTSDAGRTPPAAAKMEMTNRKHQNPRDLMAEYLAQANRLAQSNNRQGASAPSPDGRPSSLIADLQQLTQKLAAIATALETLDRVLHESLDAIQQSQTLTKEAPPNALDPSILTGNSRQEILEMIAQRLRN